MPNSHPKIAHYYQKVLEYADLAEVSILADQTGRYPRDGYPLTRENILAGQIDSTTVSKIFEDSKNNTVDVTIALDAFNYNGQFKAGMWITASLAHNGSLHISEFPSYNIAKSYLFPFVHNISIGSSWTDFTDAQEKYRIDDALQWLIAPKISRSCKPLQICAV